MDKPIDRSDFLNESNIRVLTIGLVIFLFNFSIAMLFLNEERSILSIIITYFLAGLCCGKFWPENPKRWGFWLTIPYGFAVTSLIILLILALIMGGHGEGLALGIIFTVIFIFVYFVLFLISSIGTYVGARIGARLRSHPLDKSQDNE